MTRTEQDRLGTREVPSHAYYGIQTLRAAEKFPMEGTHVHEEIIMAMAGIKKASAQAHLDLGRLPYPIGRCIVKAAEEIIHGEHLEDFILDYIQAGTHDSLNTNMNEVIANRALELMMEDKGNYALINPDHHVNLAQTASGLMSVSYRIAAHHLSHVLIQSTDQLLTTLLTKEKTIDERYTSESTSLTPGTPVWLGRQFGNSARNLLQDMKRLVLASSQLHTVSLDLPLSGSESNGNVEFVERASVHLKNIIKLNIRINKDDGDFSGSNEAFLDLSSAMMQCAMDISKLCGDIRLAAAVISPGGNEGIDLNIGMLSEAGEVLAQIAFQAVGLNHSIRFAADFGMPDRNAMPPILANNLMESMKLLIKGMESFTLTMTEDNEQRIVYR
ncbi:lyase family protein [Paenibacillus sp. KQZ6P-2]|uniref:Lyase family protein n=1 Tax=Paenibacillus mangrovi TaxID=2931978 RepID=A0A9X1WS18_9BACL|nr:lyase family protein [Paenibacillus mangrovi]MCJ8014232.1 lyase family protein [Paenibacillus mangrovi]